MRNFLLNLLEKKTGKEWILPCLAVFDLSLKKHTWQLISAINIKSIFSLFVLYYQFRIRDFYHDMIGS